MNVLKISGLTKKYGSLTAINNLNLEIPKGSVFGILGPNGSGKTTTLGMVLDVIVPTSGSFQWFGKGDNDEGRRKVGAILEKPNFYPNFTAYRNLELVCKIKQCPTYRIDEVLQQVGLGKRMHHSFRTYSLGMKQRLAIASALLNNPEVLILDEPTNGLDPQGIAEIRTLILDIADSGKTIIIASHLLDEVQKVCSDFAVLKQGNLIFSGKVDVEFGSGVRINVASDNMDLLLVVVKKFTGLIGVELVKDILEIKMEKEYTPLDFNKYLIDQGIIVNHFVVVKKTLEQQFLEILQNN